MLAAAVGHGRYLFDSSVDEHITHAPDAQALPTVPKGAVRAGLRATTTHH